MAETHEAPRDREAAGSLEGSWSAVGRGTHGRLRGTWRSLLGAPSLAAPSAEAIDGRTLRYLLKQNLKLKEEEEKLKEVMEERMSALNRGVRDGLPLSLRGRRRGGRKNFRNLSPLGALSRVSCVPWRRTSVMENLCLHPCVGRLT